VNTQSPFQLSKAVGVHLARLLSSFDIESLPRTEQQVLLTLKRLATDVRLDMRDYGLADTAAAQKQWAEAVRQRLKELDAALLEAGGLGLIGAADIAQLSALIQQLMTYV
jgi:hypothetical protein